MKKEMLKPFQGLKKIGGEKEKNGNTKWTI